MQNSWAACIYWSLIKPLDFGNWFTPRFLKGILSSGRVGGSSWSVYLTLLGDLAWRLFSGESSAVDSTAGLTGCVLGTGSNGFGPLVFFSLGGDLTALLACGSQSSCEDSRFALFSSAIFCYLWVNLRSVLFSLFFRTIWFWRLPFCLFRNSSINFLLPSGSTGSFFISTS